MSTGRVLWIIWCLWWVGVWIFTGIATFLTIVGPLVCAVLAIGSGVAIAIPIGKEKEQPPFREIEPPPPDSRIGG